MPPPHDPAEHALVLKALTCGLSDCVEWKSDALMSRVRSDPDPQGLTPRTIRRDVIDLATRLPVAVVQVEETRGEYRAERNHYYKILLSYAGLPYQIFVELILSDDDPDYPAVTIVSVHRQRS